MQPSRRCASRPQAHDLILTSGGVSVGEEDHIKPAVQSLGSLDLWQIAIKPGKPFAYGKVGACAFHRPARQSGLQLRHLPAAGAAFPAEAAGRQPDRAQAGVRCPLTSTWPRADKRREFLRARRNAEGGLDLFPNQSSGVLTSVAWGDGLIDNPPGQTIARGDAVPFLSFAELLS